MQLVKTAGIHHAMINDEDFSSFIFKSLERYFSHDWGDTSEGDKELNDLAVERGDDRIVAKYVHPRGDIFIITEWDRSVTTVLFTDEY